MKKLSNRKKGFTYLEIVLSIAVMVMIIYVIFIQLLEMERENLKFLI